MLQQLLIKNLVLIDSLVLDFGLGLNVLTGETGAGKSILLGALGLISGNRAETNLIRQGADSLSVAAVFTDCLKNDALCKLCEENALEISDEIIVKRTLSKDGKGKIIFNDQPVSQRMLKELMENLIEINGQFASHGLLDTKNHIDFLDMSSNYQSELLALKNFYNEYKNISCELKKANEQYDKTRADEELIRHYVDELQKLQPHKGEEEELVRKHQEIMHAEKIAENFNYAYQSLCNKADICSALRQAQSYVDRNNRIMDNKYDNLAQMLDNALINASDVVTELENIASGINFDADEQNRTEERLFALKAAARKHNVGIDDLPDVLNDLQEKLHAIDNSGDNITKLVSVLQKAKNEYLELAKMISSKRKQHGMQFSQKIMHELVPLKMEKAKFEVVITELPENLWNEKGIDNVEFCVATNPNSPLGRIDKIASGGELSRLMLALKVNLIGCNSVNTVIFDEIDSGIGGATAEAVGERLAKLGEELQVLVVTHSPQVAAKSSHHFKVEKNVDLLSATTIVRTLDAKEKTEEIARMISGEVISEEARAAAKVLIG